MSAIFSILLYLSFFFFSFHILCLIYFILFYLFLYKINLRWWKDCGIWLGVRWGNTKTQEVTYPRYFTLLYNRLLCILLLYYYYILSLFFVYYYIYTYIILYMYTLLYILFYILFQIILNCTAQHNDTLWCTILDYSTQYCNTLH